MRKAIRKSLGSRSGYNATVYALTAAGVVLSVCVAEVQAGAMLRSNALQCTGLEGSPEYAAYYCSRTSIGEVFYAVAGCNGYLDAFQTGVPKSVAELPTPLAVFASPANATAAARILKEKV